MRFDIITLFPEMFSAYFDESILKRAREAGLIETVLHQLRDYTTDKHHKADDTPYGGGAGMVLKVEPIYRCLEAIGGLRVSGDQSRTEEKEEAQPVVRNPKPTNLRTRSILLSAKGKRFTQTEARRLAGYDRLILVCGRYEGVDERVAEHLVDEELSLGDFVLTGGEVPAMAVVDAVSRLVPGVLGNEASAVRESHSAPGLLEYPQYTKPEEFHGWKVPQVLLSGNHAEIERFREARSATLSE